MSWAASSCSASRIFATALRTSARSAKVVARNAAKAYAARATLASISESDRASKTLTVSPVVGSIVALGMVTSRVDFRELLGAVVPAGRPHDATGSDDGAEASWRWDPDSDREPTHDQ